MPPAPLAVAGERGSLAETTWPAGLGVLLPRPILCPPWAACGKLNLLV